MSGLRRQSPKVDYARFLGILILRLRLDCSRTLQIRIWEHYCKVSNRDWKTKMYRLELLKKRFGHIPVTDFGPLDLASYVKWRKNALN